MQRSTSISWTIVEHLVRIRAKPPSSHLIAVQTLTTSDHALHDDFSSDVENIYRILRKFHSRPDKLHLALHDSGASLRPGLVERVLSRCGDAGALGFRFFTWASKQPDYHPSPTIYKSVVKMLGKMRQFGAAWALVDEMRRETPDFITPEVFIVLMRRFASSRMVSKAVEVLDEMPKYGCEPDEYVFGCLLDALCKNGSVKEASSLFEDMRDRFPPTLRHFTSLLYGWCKAGKLIEAKVVLVRMREAGFDPDIVVYNTLLSGFASAGKIEDGYDLLREMRRKGCEPNAASYTTLIQALCSKDRMDEAMHVFVEMRRCNCAADVVTYATLISGFSKAGKIDKAYEFIDEMIERGCKPNASVYLSVFLALEKKENLEECLELKLRIVKAGCFPDLGVYNTVIRLACKIGELKQAMVLWDEMEASGLSPGLDTFVIMIHGFLHQGLLIEACKYFKEMVARGLLSTPHYGTLKDLLNSLLRAEKIELAKEVWECIVSKGIQLNVYAWTIWIHALFSNKHVKEACSYCLDMMDAGLMPQPDTFAKLMKGLKKLYNRQIAAEITEKVRKMAAERNVTFKMYKRRGVMDLEKKKARAKAKAKKDKGKRRAWKGQPANSGGGRGHGRANLLDIYSEDDVPHMHNSHCNNQQLRSSSSVVEFKR
ncbi:putative pentatricopeptide repeat-containing protein At5g65820 [Dioscorea cayenensis subsp. rotundata]|uniref:Pentatricopeptide repeat-containing protein At5g65820 n=1 Tax=Dioscorea cayennensis subsp. rotundata TaxID=55577 RepID=A0AB40CBF8_DIOCR|nr:putative pentatricopeptide repeat-containing protein At5g65820 [Dioscorea cayenensis subsp. rotundata]